MKSRKNVRMGSRVFRNSHEYIIAQVECDFSEEKSRHKAEKSRYQAIDILDGNRWSDPPLPLRDLVKKLRRDGFTLKP